MRNLDILSQLNNILKDIQNLISYKRGGKASTAPSRLSESKIVVRDDGTNKVLWVKAKNQWVNVGNLISDIIDHTHSNLTGQGGQLDWDTCWSDAVHSHQTDAEGGTLDHGAAMTGLTDDDHTHYRQYAFMMS